MSNPDFQPTPDLAYLREHGRDGHIVQLYSDDSFLIDVLSRFVGSALAIGDGAVVLATAPHRAELEKRLAARGLETVKAAVQGRYISLDASETLLRIMVKGQVDENRFNDVISGVLSQIKLALGEGDCRIAVFGELVALLWAEGKGQEAIRIEQLWNKMSEKYSFSLLCAYPMAGFGNERHIEPFLKICREHSDVVPSENYMALSSETDRLRRIAELQQKAHALEQELGFRQSEERFRLLVEAVRDYAIFMLDTDGRIVSWNIGAERIKGYKAEEILGKYFGTFYPEDDVLNGKPQWELIIAAKEGRFEDEGWRLRKDGSRFWANVIITAMRNASGTLIGYAKVTRDMTERIKVQRALEAEVAEKRDAQRQLINSANSLRELSLHLLRTQDEERRRIGRDLHDSLGQYLAVLKMKLESLAMLVAPNDGSIAADFEECASLTNDCIKEVRTASYLLYPPMLEEMGLISAIPWYLDGFSARSGIRSQFDVGEDCGRLPRDSELAMFRVLQESVTNVHRHSGSPTVKVRLFTEEGMCILEVQDQGKGLPEGTLEPNGKQRPNATGVGIRSMDERIRHIGGRLELISSEHGTIVRAMVPSEPVIAPHSDNLKVPN